MNALAYNVSVAAGVLMVGIGAGAQWGWPVGLMAAGLLIVALSVVAARLMAGSR
jgi:hypothetical protein